MFNNCTCILTGVCTEAGDRIEHLPNSSSWPAEVEESGPAGVICTVMDGPCCLSWCCSAAIFWQFQLLLKVYNRPSSRKSHTSISLLLAWVCVLSEFICTSFGQKNTAYPLPSGKKKHDIIIHYLSSSFLLGWSYPECAVFLSFDTSTVESLC